MLKLLMAMMVVINMAMMGVIKIAMMKIMIFKINQQCLSNFENAIIDIYAIMTMVYY